MSTAIAQRFADLPSDTLQAFAAYGVTKTYAKNTVLVCEGDASQNFYVIIEGKVKVFVSDEEGKEIVVNVQKSGDCFGELALIDEAPRSASVMTLEPSKVCVTSRSSFYRCLEDHPDVAAQFLKLMVRRVRGLTDNVKSLALQDVYGRVIRTLLNLASEQDGGKLVIEQRLTHQTIADIVGASREMVSRIMKELRSGGYVTVENKQITIHGKLPTSF